MVMLVDSHVHLDRYSDEQIAGMVARAEAAGAGRLLTIGVDGATSRAALVLASRHRQVLAAVGVHPTRVAEGAPPPGLLPIAMERGRGARSRGAGEELRGLLGETGSQEAIRAGRLVAIGEVGLDEGAPDLAGQARFLEACVEMALDRDLPLVLHVVGGEAIHERALEIVGRPARVRAVAHYFVGGPDLARRYVEAGCWVSVGRPVTRVADRAVRAAVPTIPLDRLLLETDTYPLPGRTTEPQDVATVCTAVAELTGRSYDEVAAETTANFAAFLGRRYAVPE
jgi:TatD DNase family protein